MAYPVRAPDRRNSLIEARNALCRLAEFVPIRTARARLPFLVQIADLLPRNFFVK